eukprot:gene46894-47078_t
MPRGHRLAIDNNSKTDRDAQQQTYKQQEQAHSPEPHPPRSSPHPPWRQRKEHFSYRRHAPRTDTRGEGASECGRERPRAISSAAAHAAWAHGRDGDTDTNAKAAARGRADCG